MSMLALLAAMSIPAAPGPAKPSAVPDRISFTRQSWGAIIERWTVTGNRVEYEHPQHASFDGSPVQVEVKRFKLKASDQRRLRALLTRLEDAGKLPDSCDNYIPDGPYGFVAWSRGGREAKVNFTASCMEGANAKKAAAGFAVGALASELAKAEPLAETKTAD